MKRSDLQPRRRSGGLWSCLHPPLSVLQSLITQPKDLNTQMTGGSKRRAGGQNGAASNKNGSEAQLLPAAAEGLYPPYSKSAEELAAAAAPEARSDEELRAAAAASPFICLDYPIGLYEGTKLLLMLPVVVLKVRRQGWQGAF